MPEYRAITLNSQKTNSGAYGNTVTFVNDVTPGSLTTADSLKVLMIPAGTLLTELVIANDDLDSNGAPTSVVKIGYVNKDGTAAPGGADVAFGAGLTIMQAANRTLLRFNPFLITKDIHVTIVPTINAATFATGKVFAVATGLLING